jgi:hypothetical protein
MPAVQSRAYPSLFNGDRQACHNAMLEVIDGVLAEIKAEGGEIPEFEVFYPTVLRLWLRVWIKHA